LIFATPFRLLFSLADELSSPDDYAIATFSLIISSSFFMLSAAARRRSRKKKKKKKKKKKTGIDYFAMPPLTLLFASPLLATLMRRDDGGTAPGDAINMLPLPCYGDYFRRLSLRFSFHLIFDYAALASDISLLFR
jgi:hypothetical protein